MTKAEVSVAFVWRWRLDNVVKTMPFLPAMNGNGKHNTYIFMVMTGGWFIVLTTLLWISHMWGFPRKCFFDQFLAGTCVP